MRDFLFDYGWVAVLVAWAIVGLIVAPLAGAFFRAGTGEVDEFYGEDE